VVVTGAGRGLGRAYARACAEAGADVVVNDIDAAAARSVSEEILSSGRTAAASDHDVSSWEGAAALVGMARSELGRIDGLVANAAVIHYAKPWEEYEAALRRIVEVNVLGVLFCGQHAMRAMVEQGDGGSIVAITSGARLGLRGMSAYGATKGAVASMVHSWAIEGAEHGIRVNAVSPLAKTDMASVFPPEERMELGPPEGVAPLVVALLSPQSAPLTGAISRFGGAELFRTVPERAVPVEGLQLGDMVESAESIAALLVESHR
jgi:NAD(P)-dependent dehydrogenase (short-subunit alcohol dehydrogenase family)